MPCPYKKCDGSGLIPFKREDGSIMPHTWRHCDCHPQYGMDAHEHYSEIRPGDYDFACSGLFRAWAYQHCGVLDPGYVPSQPDIEDLEDRIGNLEAISAEPGMVPRHFHDELKQIRGHVLSLQSKVIRLSATEKIKQTKKEEKGEVNSREDITDKMYKQS